MEHIVGKTIVFSDQHFGVKSNSPLRQKIGVQVVKDLILYSKKNKVSNIIFCGDWFHSRSSVDVSTLDIAFKCIQALARCCKIWMIIGNHDLYLKNSVEVSSINIFKDLPNVRVIAEPTEVMLNSKLAILVPWLSNLDGYKKSSFDMMLGHFEISAKFLIQSYVEDNSAKLEANAVCKNLIDEDLSLESSDKDKKSNLANLLGSFVELVKPHSGVILAGHIHQHKEMIAKEGRRFIFIGSPYEQNLGDINNKCGFYVINEEGALNFIVLDDLPKHIQLKMSEIKKVGIENFDFKVVSGNIIQKVYDEELSQVEDAAIAQKINDFKPYEELLSEYKVSIQYALKSKDDQTSIDLLKKSKLDYIKNYIDNIDEDVLNEGKTTKDKLFEILKAYYQRVIDK